LGPVDLEGSVVAGVVVLDGDGVGAGGEVGGAGVGGEGLVLPAVDDGVAVDDDADAVVGAGIELVGAGVEVEGAGVAGGPVVGVYASAGSALGPVVVDGGGFTLLRRDVPPGLTLL
jgi:hypothetical protein